MRSFWPTFAALLYLAATGVRSPTPPTQLTNLGWQSPHLVNDTDTDDDSLSFALSGPHSDEAVHQFEQSLMPAVEFHALGARVVAVESPTHDRLDDGGLFRPPRIALS